MRTFYKMTTINAQDIRQILNNMLLRNQQEQEQTAGAGAGAQIKTTYSDDFKHIKLSTIRKVRKIIIEKKYFRQNDENKFNLLKELLNFLNNEYQTETQLNRTQEQTAGYYNIAEKTIYLNKLSLMTFLHEFKHSIQAQKNRTNNEDIARGWSISLFKRASLKHYNRAKEKGILLYT